MSIKLTGCGPKYAALLHEAGYSSTEQLGAATPELLQQKLVTVNAEKVIVSKTPRLTIIEGWINEAQNLPASNIVSRGRIMSTGYVVGRRRATESNTPGLSITGSRKGLSIKAGDERGKNIISGRGRKRGLDRDFEVTELPGIDKRKKSW